MNINQAIELAQSPKALSELLGVSIKHVYNMRCSGKFPRKHEDRLRVLKPSWFRKPKAQQ